MYRILKNFGLKSILKTIYLSFMIFVFLSEVNAQSLNTTLANAYSNHPLLFSERTEERVISEDIAEALSGWKPEVYLDASLGKTLVNTQTSTTSKTNSNLPVSMGIVVEQKLYDGGKINQNIKIADANFILSQSKLMII